MNTFYVYPNPQKNGVRELLADVCQMLRSMGANVIVPQACRAIYEGDATGVAFHEPEDALRLAQAIIVLGGDGTILRIAKLAARMNVPILGVNFGNIGFLTELESDELTELRKLLEDKYVLDTRMMLRVHVTRDGKTIYENDALNDVVVTRGERLRVVFVRIDADDEHATSFHGDGVIVSTPTGTTAYALSAGGPVVEPSAENIAVTPICAHALHAQSFLFACERKITLHAESLSQKSVYLSVDGGQGFEVQPQDEITIVKSPLKLRLLRIKGKSFYAILQKKL